jgi:hypothetical protein
MEQDASAVKKALLSVLLSAVVLLGGYGVLVGAVCIWVGARSTHQDGFWVPLLAGGLTVAVVFLVFIPAVRALRRALRGSQAGPELEGY